MVKNTKIIIGLVGEKGVGKTTAALVMKDKGFYKCSIKTKVKEFAGHLFNELNEENEEKILQQVRKRGKAIHKYYWLNLLLMSIPEEKKYIVIDDIELDDANNFVKIYSVYRPSISKERIKNVEEIVNEGTKEEFEKKIQILAINLKKK